MMNIFEELLSVLNKAQLTMTTAESLTGGMLAASIVDIPGASFVYKEGFVTYCSEAKIRTLGVSPKTISRLGAICAETAIEMAKGAAKRTGCDIAVSTTGNAGPVCEEKKETGLVYIGVYIRGKSAAYEFRFKGDRFRIRKQAAAAAAEKCLSFLNAEGYT